MYITVLSVLQNKRYYQCGHLVPHACPICSHQGRGQTGGVAPWSQQNGPSLHRWLWDIAVSHWLTECPGKQEWSSSRGPMGLLQLHSFPRQSAAGTLLSLLIQLLRILAKYYSLVCSCALKKHVICLSLLGQTGCKHGQICIIAIGPIHTVLIEMLTEDYT